MKSIRQNQSAQINDTCSDCGSFMDIGAVINEDDKVLVENFEGEGAQAEAEHLANLASSRFQEVQYALAETEAGIQLTINFAVAAEKMIFQLEQGL